jgi:hypothetical protein
MSLGWLVGVSEVLLRCVEVVVVGLASHGDGELPYVLPRHTCWDPVSGASGACRA